MYSLDWEEPLYICVKFMRLAIAINILGLVHNANWLYIYIYYARGLIPSMIGTLCPKFALMPPYLLKIYLCFSIHVTLLLVFERLSISRINVNLLLCLEILSLLLLENCIGWAGYKYSPLSMNTMVGVVKNIFPSLKLQIVGGDKKVCPSPNSNLCHFIDIVGKFVHYGLIPLLGIISMIMDYRLVSLSLFHHMHLKL